MNERARAQTEWDVSIDFTSPGVELDARVVDDLLDATQEYAGIVSVLPQRITIAVTLAAPTYREALESGVSLAQDALQATGCGVALQVERVEATSAARAERDLEVPTYPEMMGVSEVAEFLGVSKQRVSELREGGRLPEPLSELRGGPVWPRPTIELFLERWTRRPGRPPAGSSAHAGVRESAPPYALEAGSAEASRLRKWIKWVEGPKGGEERKDSLVYRDVVELLIMSRQIWRRFHEILFQEAPAQARKNATFDDWLTYNYFGAMGAGVRRQVETRDDVVSLGRLLTEIDADGVTALPHGSLKLGEAKRDLIVLSSKTKVVVTWVNKDFAHSDPKRGSFSASTTLGDIDRAVDAVFATFAKYRGLLVGASTSSEVEMTAWETVFRVPWLPKQRRDTGLV